MEKSKAVEQVETQNAFVGTLTNLRRGRTLTELSESLAEVVAEVRRTGKPGSLILKVKVTAGGKDDDAVVVLSDEITAKLPKMNTVATIMYANDENQLTRDDPRQQEMKLHAVEKDTGKPANFKPAVAATA